MTKKQKRARPSGQGAHEIEASLLQWGDAKEFTKVKFDWLDALAFNADVSHTAFRLAYILASQYLSRKDGVAWPSLPTLADHIGASEKTVQEQIKLLVELRYLTKKRGGNGLANRYRIAFPDRKKTSDLQGNRPEENFRSADGSDRKFLGKQTGRKLPPNPYEEPSDLKGDAKASPHENSQVEIGTNHFTAARAPDARTQPDEQVSTATETTAMIDDAINPILDSDDEHERPAADWPPEGEAFAEVPVDPDDEPSDPEAERRAALDAARERGARNRRKGMPRKAVPSELRADPELTDAYWAGFDEADAELRSTKTTSPEHMTDADREAYRAGQQAYHDGFEKQAPTSLGGWGSAWAAWMTGWTEAETANGARS